MRIYKIDTNGVRNSDYGRLKKLLDDRKLVPCIVTERIGQEEAAEKPVWICRIGGRGGYHVRTLDGDGHTFVAERFEEKCADLGLEWLSF